MAAGTRDSQHKYKFWIRDLSDNHGSVRLSHRGVGADFLDALYPHDPTLRTQVNVYKFVHDITLDDLYGQNVEEFINNNPTALAVFRPHHQLGLPRDDNHLDFVIQLPQRNQTPQSKEPDILAELPTYRFNCMMTLGSQSQPPSKGAKTSNYKSAQAKGHPILDGRYDADNHDDNTGPPIEIFHPCFGQFKQDMKCIDSEISNKQLIDTANFVRKASGISFSEDDRSETISPALTEIIKVVMTKAVNTDTTSADGLYTYDIFGGARRALVCLEQDRNEIGTGGSAPDVQACLSLRRWWAQEINRNTANVSCCPCFILATAGPYFIILGAVMTQSLIVQPLTPYIRAVDMSLDEAHYVGIARIFRALSRGIANLKTYWDKVPCPKDLSRPIKPRFYPWRTSFPGTPDQKTGVSDEVHIEYSQPLEKDLATVTFLAKVKDLSKQVVVKFTEAGRYGSEAHKLLAKKDRAPNLLYAGELSSGSALWMIVMDYVDGVPLADSPTSWPSDVKDQIRAALDLLHAHGFVFGDLRLRNVMLGKDGKIKLIDFDWVGKAGVSKYPLHMNPNVKWAPGMGRLEIMRKEHDLAMLDNLCSFSTWALARYGSIY